MGHFNLKTHDLKNSELSSEKLHYSLDSFFGLFCYSASGSIFLIFWSPSFSLSFCPSCKAVSSPASSSLRVSTGTFFQSSGWRGAGPSLGAGFLTGGGDRSALAQRSASPAGPRGRPPGGARGDSGPRVLSGLCVLAVTARATWRSLRKSSAPSRPLGGTRRDLGSAEESCCVCCHTAPFAAVPEALFAPVSD